MSLKVLDLFAGAGGMALGFRAAGARCIGAVEWDQAAADTFARTFAEDAPVVFGGPERGDVNNLPVEDLLAALPDRPDIVVGGPPCQGFSRIGRAKQASLLGVEERTLLGGVTDPSRNLLYQYFLAVVRQAQPLAFVMENVPGMREHMGGDFAKKISREASHAGYNVRYFLLNAAEYGVPQVRWRLFFVGYRSDLGVHAIPQPPPRTHRLMRDGVAMSAMQEGSSLPDDPWMVSGDQIPWVDVVRPAVTVREAIGDLPRFRDHLRGQEPRELRLVGRGEPNEYVRSLQNWPGLPTVTEPTGHWYRFTGFNMPDPAPEGRDFPIFREMAQGDRYPEALAIAHRRFRAALDGMPERPEPGSAAWDTLQAKYIPPYRNDAFHDKWRKLAADEPSWTVTAHLSRDTYSHIHYDSRQARTITVREAARLQSFPDAVEFCGNYGDQYRQIGNAVPVWLAREMALRVVASIGVGVARLEAVDA